VRLWHFIKRASAKQFWQLILLCLGNIRLLWPTYKATKQAVKYSNEFYGTTHHKNTPANAFRHAIWNYLIARNCSTWSKNETKIVAWTKDITHLHERILPGNELANAMDLHNNAVGLYVYLTNKRLALDQATTLLRTMAKDSIKITFPEELKNLPNDQLVHILETPTT